MLDLDRMQAQSVPGLVRLNRAMAERDLAFSGVAGQREALRTGEVTPRELVEASLRRIERLDPELNAFRRVFEERSLSEADLALGRLRDGDERPLLGLLPVANKDNVDVAGDVTTLGTRGYGEPAERDCEIVRRARDAGPIVVGRTHAPPLGRRIDSPGGSLVRPVRTRAPEGTHVAGADGRALERDQRFGPFADRVVGGATATRESDPPGMDTTAVRQIRRTRDDQRS